MSYTKRAVLLDRLVRRMHAELQRKAAAFDTYRVGPGGGMLLLTLSELGCVPMNTLAVTLVRDKAQITREIRALETKGLVQRHQDEKDLRVVLLTLSAEGEVFVKVLQSVLASVLEGQLEMLSDSEKTQFEALLAKALEKGKACN